MAVDFGPPDFHDPQEVRKTVTMEEITMADATTTKPSSGGPNPKPNAGPEQSTTSGSPEEQEELRRQMQEDDMDAMEAQRRADAVTVDADGKPIGAVVFDEEKAEVPKYDKTDPAASFPCQNPACNLLVFPFGQAGATLVCSCGWEYSL